MTWVPFRVLYGFITGFVGSIGFWIIWGPFEESWGVLEYIMSAKDRRRDRKEQ